MARYFVLLLALVASIYAQPNFICTKDPFVFVSKTEWEGRDPTNIIPLTNPVPYVIIHHTQHPPECYTRDLCSQYMRAMQNYHMNTQEFDDIGYSFVVGGDMAVYEGRGWEAVGGHALGFNSNSIGISLMGDFNDVLPPPEQLQIVKDLITFGVQLGYISKDYVLLGHRQVRNTNCPGDALFAEISTWDRFSPDGPTIVKNIH